LASPETESHTQTTRRRLSVSIAYLLMGAAITYMGLRWGDRALGLLRDGEGLSGGFEVYFAVGCVLLGLRSMVASFDSVPALTPVLGVFHSAFRRWMWLLVACNMVTVPILAFVFVFILPAVFWPVARLAPFLRTIGQQAYLYLTYVLLAFIVTQKAHKLVARVEKFFGAQYMFPELPTFSFIERLKPRYVRLYIYAITAGAYCISTVERLAGQVLFASPWWQASRELALEVLLTYVAVDAIAEAYKGDAIR